jgi:acetyl esterase
MTFVHPQLQAVLDVSRGQPGIADVSVEVARAQIVARTAARPRGPEVAEVRELAIPRAGGEIPLRLYRPDRPAGVAVVFHGGGWMVASRDSFDATSRHLALDSGLAVVSVEYRLAPEHPFPAALEDAWTATRWVAENGKALGVDTSRLVVLGESAGGNLAAVVALMARDAGSPKIFLQVLVYPAVDARLQGSALDQFAEGYLQTKRDVLHAFRTYGLGSVVDASDWRLSPLLAPSHANVAPALIISAECDAMRDDSAAYARRLLECGVRCSHVRYETMLHLFFGMRGLIWEAELAQKQVAAAMRDAVRGVE